ncbi:MAG: hypothetical protein AAFX56_02860 [Pseudomonadota bacterium]
MRLSSKALVLVSFLSYGVAAAGSDADSAQLKALFDADQLVRSDEYRTTGKGPSLEEERERRFAVFALIAEGGLRTANDYFRAGMILHHTSSIVQDSGAMVSLGTENKLLAFFLFGRAAVPGHKSGRPMMAVTYNYYLSACGFESDLFGYKFEDGELPWRPNADEGALDALRCDFEPRP